MTADIDHACTNPWQPGSCHVCRDRVRYWDVDITTTPSPDKDDIPPELVSYLSRTPTAIVLEKAGPNQCIRCRRYLTQSRLNDASWINNCCAECVTNGIPLARVRATLSDPLSHECLSVLAEECSEVIQRKEKIVRWGWDADYEGTTQQHKLESELGDVLATFIIAAHNGQITYSHVIEAANRKLEKFRQDAAGPRQRLLLAQTPTESAAGILAFWSMFEATDDERVEAMTVWCSECGDHLDSCRVRGKCR